jgi:hypothetical protein
MKLASVFDFKRFCSIFNAKAYRQYTGLLIKTDLHLIFAAISFLRHLLNSFRTIILPSDLYLPLSFTTTRHLSTDP